MSKRKKKLAKIVKLPPIKIALEMPLPLAQPPVITWAARRKRIMVVLKDIFIGPLDKGSK